MLSRIHPIPITDRPPTALPGPCLSSEVTRLTHVGMLGADELALVLVTRLEQSGIDVTVVDTDPPTVLQCLDRGLTASTDARLLGTQATVMCLLTDPDLIKETLDRAWPDPHHRTLLLLGALGVPAVVDLHRWAERRAIRLLDCPVFGTPDDLHDVFVAGQATYAVTQLLVTAHLVAAAEALALAKASGLDVDRVRRQLLKGPGYSWTLASRSERMTIEPAVRESVHPLASHVRGFDAVTATVRELDLAAPLAGMLATTLAAAHSQGLSQSDDASVIDTYHPPMWPADLRRPAHAMALGPVRNLVLAAAAGSDDLGGAITAALGRPTTGEPVVAVWADLAVIVVRSELRPSITVGSRPTVEMRQVPLTENWISLHRIGAGTTARATVYRPGSSTVQLDIVGYRPESYELPDAVPSRPIDEFTVVSRHDSGLISRVRLLADDGAGGTDPSSVMLWWGDQWDPTHDSIGYRRQVVVDTLVHRGQLPPLVHVLVSQPAGGPPDEGETDPLMDPSTACHLFGQVLSEVAHRVPIRRDAASCAIAGTGSRGMAAIAAAWQLPHRCGRVLSLGGSDPTRRTGGYGTLSRLIRHTPQSLRIWLSDGGALGDGRPEGDHQTQPNGAHEDPHGRHDHHHRPGSSPESDRCIETIDVTQALSTVGCEHHLSFGRSPLQGALDLPEALQWLWRPSLRHPSSALTGQQLGAVETSPNRVRIGPIAVRMRPDRYRAAPTGTRTSER